MKPRTSANDLGVRAARLAGSALLVIAFVGFFVGTRRMDRGSSVIVLRAAPGSWRAPQAGAAVELPLGELRVPAGGVVQLSVCGVAVGEGLQLRLRDAPGQGERRVPLADEAGRVAHCGAATLSVAADRRYSTALEAPAGRHSDATLDVQLRASYPITPRSLWPALVLLLGFAVLVAGPRDATPPPADLAPDARPELPFRALGTQGGATRRRSPAEQPWAAAAALGGYLLIYPLVITVAALYRRAGGALDSGTAFGVFTVVQQGYLVALAAWLVSAWRAPSAREALGLRRLTAAQAAMGVGLGLGLVAVAVAVTRLFIRDVSASPMGRMLENVPVRYALGFTALLAPLTEEIFFRGVLVRVFGRRSVAVGVAGGALVFTLAHALQLEGAWAGLVPIALVAVVNGWLRVRSGGVSQPWVVHTVYNGVLALGIFGA